jgi:hypothetical protein
MGEQLARETARRTQIAERWKASGVSISRARRSETA